MSAKDLVTPAPASYWHVWTFSYPRLLDFFFYFRVVSNKIVIIRNINESGLETFGVIIWILIMIAQLIRQNLVSEFVWKN